MQHLLFLSVTKIYYLPAKGSRGSGLDNNYWPWIVCTARADDLVWFLDWGSEFFRKLAFIMCKNFRDCKTMTQWLNYIILKFQIERRVFVRSEWTVARQWKMSIFMFFAKWLGMFKHWPTTRVFTVASGSLDLLTRLLLLDEKSLVFYTGFEISISAIRGAICCLLSASGGPR